MIKTVGKKVKLSRKQAIEKGFMINKYGNKYYIETPRFYGGTALYETYDQALDAIEERYPILFRWEYNE